MNLVNNSNSNIESVICTFPNTILLHAMIDDDYAGRMFTAYKIVRSRSITLTSHIPRAGEGIDSPEAYRLYFV